MSPFVRISRDPLLTKLFKNRNSATGLNWRRLATVTIDEQYLVEYPELSNQEIALREILEEVERRVIDHGVDLARLDNAELQGTIKDVMSDILVVTSLLHCFIQRSAFYLWTSCRI